MSSTFPKYTMNTMFPHGYDMSHQVISLNSEASAKLITCDRLNVVGVVILNQHHQILCSMNTKRNVWDIPQGVVEIDDESSISALVREIEEEIGLAIEETDLYPLANFSNVANGIPSPFHTKVYMLRTVQGETQFPINYIANTEPHKNCGLAFRALSQLPQPQGLSLRMVAELLK